MGIGKSSWKEAKEKAKAAGKKIRQKRDGIVKSPVNFAGGAAIAAGGLQSSFGLGNPTTQASAFEKLRGIGNQNTSAFSGMNFPGTQPMANTFAFNRIGSPFQLKKSKTFSPSSNEEVDPTKYAERRKKSIDKQKKERQATLDSSGETYTNHITGRRYRVGTGPNPNLG